MKHPLNNIKKQNTNLKFWSKQFREIDYQIVKEPVEEAEKEQTKDGRKTCRVLLHWREEFQMLSS